MNHQSRFEKGVCGFGELREAPTNFENLRRKLTRPPFKEGQQHRKLRFNEEMEEQ
jgi:hypothetical protein